MLNTSKVFSSACPDSQSYVKELTYDMTTLEKRIAEIPPSSPSGLPTPVQRQDDYSLRLFPLLERCELPSISADILKALIVGKQTLQAKSLVIIDTRYDFEFSGGHIKGAINVNDPNSIEFFYSKYLDKGKETVVIFHCEFSSARAPKLFRHMRNVDRQSHIEVYPQLGFPYMYILHGGYKMFFDLYPDLCEPKEYIRMSDPLHVEHLKLSARLLKRSWSMVGNKSRSSEEEVLNDVSNLVQQSKIVRRPCSTCLSFNS